MLRERTDDVNLSILGLLIAGDNFWHRLWLKVAQPNKEVPKHFQRGLLAGLHRFAKDVSLAQRIRKILELSTPAERDGAVEAELRSVFETLWECIGRENLKERIRGAGSQEGNVVGPGFWEDGR